MGKYQKLVIVCSTAIVVVCSSIAYGLHCHGDEGHSIVSIHSIDAQITSHFAEWKKAVLDFDQPSARKATGATKLLGCPAIPRLVAMLNDADLHSQGFALASLEEFGESAFAAKSSVLRVLYAKKDAGLIIYAIRTLDAISPDWADSHIDFLIHLLDYKDDNVRAYAIGALAGAGPNAKTAIEPLINVFKNDIRNCQAHAATALCSIAPTDPRVIAAAASEYEKGNPWALDALLQAGPAAKPLIPLLTRMLAADPEQSYIDPDAAIILGRIGPAASPAIPLMIKHMNTHGLGNVSSLASACATALGQMGVANEEVISALILNAMGNDDTEVKRAAIQALGNLGPPAKDALPILRQILSNRDYTLRADVVKAIEMIKRAKGTNTRAFKCDECELRCRRGGLLRRLRFRRRHCYMCPN